MTNSTEPSNAHTTRQEIRTSLSSSDEQDDVGTEVFSKLVIELMAAMPAATVKPAIREVAMAPHSSAAQIVVFQGCQGTASIWWVDKARGTSGSSAEHLGIGADSSPNAAESRNRVEPGTSPIHL
jgi:hypothetical protein